MTQTKTHPIRHAQPHIEHNAQPIARALSAKRNRRRFSLSVLLLLVMIISLDWLFYEKTVGISMAIAFALLGIATILAGRHLGTTPRRWRLPAVLLVLAVLPGVENLSSLSLLFGFFGVALVSFLGNEATRRDPLAWLWALGGFLTRMPARLVRDMWVAISVMWRKGSMPNPTAILSVGLVPILVTMIFLIIFRKANPLLDQWLRSIDLTSFAHAMPNSDRILLWLLCAFLCWPFLRLSRKLYRPNAAQIPPAQDMSREIAFLKSVCLNDKSVLLSLTLFNTLFALQNATDIHLFTSGMTLPEGYSFSEFAHEGANALMVATLLAACFILAYGSKRDTGPSALAIRALLYLWVGQTMLLVILAMQRLHLYVDAYSLTHMRLSSFIWMGLILVGLVLILIKLTRAKSGRWLVNANSLATILVLYIVSFVNTPLLIARYNIAVAKDNPAINLDATYLIALGPDALPAVDALANDLRYDDLRKRLASSGTDRQYLNNIISDYWIEIDQRHDDWRCWSFRNARLLSSVR